MPGGEVHFGIGVMIQQAAEGKPWGLPVAIVLAVASHWVDDWNIGLVARIYHGLATGWRKWISLLFRGLVICALGYIGWTCPRYLICGLTAWLVFDHEWLVGWLIGRHGYGLHANMWPNWLRGRWALIVRGALAILLVAAIWPYGD